MDQRALHVGFVLAVLALAQPAYADEEVAGGRPWAVGLGVEVDEASSDSMLASLNFGLSDETWLSFGAGRSRSSQRAADLVAETLVAGFEHRFGRIGIGLDAERFGDPDALESTDLGAALYIYGERFRVGLRSERRAIDVHFTVTGPLGGTLERTAGVDADGTELELRVELTERLQTYAGATSYDYSRDVALLPRIDRLNLLATSALTLGSALIDERAALGLEWELGARVLSVDYTRDRSAVDGSRFASVGAAILLPISVRMDLEINVGNSRSDVGDAGRYAGLLLLIYGGAR